MIGERTLAMFLQRITLDNVRSIEHLDLSVLHTEHEDVREWTFLLGENGSGKTTLLRAIALVLGGSETLRELVGDPADWVRRGASQARIRAEVLSVEGEPSTAELIIGAEDNLKLIYDRNRGLDALDQALALTPRNYFTVGYGVSRRPAAEEEHSIGIGGSLFRHPRARSVATLFSPHASLTSLEGWALDLDYRSEGGYDIVREAINALLPGIALAEIDRDRRELIFDTPDGRIPYRLLSEGYQNVAAWTGDLLYQITSTFEGHTDPFEARGLLLIDEIDLHLHPVWQRGLMAFIESRFPKLQVVATTHSPLTVHQAQAGELYFLRREQADGPTVLHAYEGAPRDLMLHQLLLSPVFGLASLDSRPVEEMKHEYRALRDADDLPPDRQRRLNELSAELRDLPEWSQGIGDQEDIKNLMADIRSQLRGR